MKKALALLTACSIVLAVNPYEPPKPSGSFPEYAIQQFTEVREIPKDVTHRTASLACAMVLGTQGVIASGLLIWTLVAPPEAQKAMNDYVVANQRSLDIQIVSAAVVGVFVATLATYLRSWWWNSSVNEQRRIVVRELEASLRERLETGRYPVVIPAAVAAQLKNLPFSPQGREDAAKVFVVTESPFQE